MNKRSTVLHVVTPFLLAAISAGIAVAAAIKPYDKAKVYANLAFMDSLRSDDSGLVIRDNEIITGYDGATSPEGEVIRPKFGEMYAILSSDSLDLDVPVYWGSNSELLEHGACQSSASAVIGTQGNTVISAHVDTFFDQLDKLKKDDIITLNTNYGEFTYKVDQQVVFTDKDRRYIVPTEDTHLTLYTCKRDLLGASNQRIGVVCKPVRSAFYTGEKEVDE